MRCNGRCPGPVPPTAQAWINMVLGMASLPGTLWLAMTLDDTRSEASLSSFQRTAAWVELDSANLRGQEQWLQLSVSEYDFPWQVWGARDLST